MNALKIYVFKTVLFVIQLIIFAQVVVMESTFQMGNVLINAHLIKSKLDKFAKIQSLQ